MNKILLLDSSSKLNADIANQIQKIKIANQPSIIRLETNLKNIELISKVNNDVIIKLSDGKQLLLENFFSQANHLVVNGSNEELLWVKFTDEAGNFIDPVQYEPIESLELLEKEEESSGLMALVPILAGGIAFWALKTIIDDSSNNSSVDNSDGGNDGGDGNSNGGDGDNDSDLIPPILVEAQINEAGVIELTFDKNLDTNVVLDLSNFKVIDGQVGELSIGSIQFDANNPNKILIQTSPLIMNTQNVVIKYIDPTTGNDDHVIQNVDGADSASFEQTLTNNSEIEDGYQGGGPGGGGSDAPVLETAIVNSSGIIELTFDRNLDTDVALDLSNFKVIVDNTTELSIDYVQFDENDPKKIIIETTPLIMTQQNVVIQYTDPTTGNDDHVIQNVDGIDSASFDQLLTNNSAIVDDGDYQGGGPGGGTPGSNSDAPELVTAIVNANGDIELTFNKNLKSFNLPASSVFEVTVDGQQIQINTYDVIYEYINGESLFKKLLLETEPKILENQIVSVKYTDPTPGVDDIDVLESQGDHVDVESFEVTLDNQSALTNGGSTPGGNEPDPNESGEHAPELIKAEVNTQGVLELTFDRSLDANNLAQAQDFIILVNQQPVVITSITVDSHQLNKVILTTSPVITMGQSVIAVYNDPTTGNDIQALQGLTGLDVASFNTSADGIQIDNQSVQQPPDTIAPELILAEVNFQGVIELTFNEILDAVNIPAAKDFQVKVDGQFVTITSVEIDADYPNKVIITTYPVISKNQHVQVIYQDPSVGNDYQAIQDIPGNDTASFDTGTGSSVQNNSLVPPADTTPPELTHAEVNTQGVIELSFSEPLDPQHPPQAGDFIVTVDGQEVVITDLTIVDNIVLLTTEPSIRKDQDVVVVYKDPSAFNDPNALQDTNGNDVQDFDTSANNGIPVDNNSLLDPLDITPPLLTHAEVNIFGTIVLTFDEALNHADTAATKDFQVFANDVQLTVISMSINNNKVVLHTVPLVAEGQTVEIRYNDPSIGNDIKALQDNHGNDVASFDTVLDGIPVINNSGVEPEDVTPPELTSAIVNPNGTITLSFDELLDVVNPPQAKDFIIEVDGERVVIADITLNNNKVHITTVPNIFTDQVVTVNYNDPTTYDDIKAIQDTKGNDAFDFQAVLENRSVQDAPDITPPELTKAEVNESGLIVLSFDESLSNTDLPQFHDFQIYVDNELVTITSIDVLNNKVILTTATPITQGQTVVVQYQDPSIGDDIKAIQDIVGNDAASFDTSAVGGIPVVNDSLIEARDTTPPYLTQAIVNQNGIIELTFNEALDSTNIATAKDFLIIINDELVAIASVVVNSSNPNKVIVTTAPLITSGQDVVVKYNDPTTFNDPKAIQDVAGNDAESFDTSAVGGIPVVNNSDIPAADTTPPYLTYAEVNAQGVIELTFNESLDQLNPAQLNAYTVLINNQSVAIQSAVVDPQDPTKLIIILADAVVVGDEVVVQYQDPTIYNDPKAIQDMAGNDAISFDTSATGGVPVINNSEVDPSSGPEFLDFIFSYTHVVLYFDKELDGNHLPLPEHFVINTYDQFDGNGQPAPRQVTIERIEFDPDNPESLTIHFNELIYPQNLFEVSYQDPSSANDEYAIQDLNGRDAENFSFSHIIASPGMEPAPEVLSAEVNADGILELYFDRDVFLPRTANPSDFVIRVDSVEITVTEVYVDPNQLDKLIVVTSPVINAGAVVIVEYTDPTPDDDIDAIQNYDEVDAESFVIEAVNYSEQGIVLDTPPELISLEVNYSGILELIFNEDIDPVNLPAPNDFIITANGVVITVQSIQVDALQPSKVYVTTTPVITVGQAITVIYKDPTSANDDNALQDLVGNDAATFVHSAPNLSQVPAADVTPPQLIKAKIIESQVIELLFDETLDPDNQPDLSDFIVYMGGTRIDIEAFEIFGNKVSLIATQTIPLNAELTIVYQDPTSSNDPDVLQDVAGNDVVSFIHTITNTPISVQITTIADDFILSQAELTAGIIQIEGTVTGLTPSDVLERLVIHVDDQNGSYFSTNIINFNHDTNTGVITWQIEIDTNELDLIHGLVPQVEVIATVKDSLDQETTVSDKEIFNVDLVVGEGATHEIHFIDDGDDYDLNAAELDDGVVVLSGHVNAESDAFLYNMVVEIADQNGQVVYTFENSEISKTGLSWSIDVSESDFDFAAYPNHKIIAKPVIRDSVGNEKALAPVEQNYQVDLVIDSVATVTVTQVETDNIVNQAELADGYITVTGTVSGLVGNDFIFSLKVKITHGTAPNDVSSELIVPASSIVNNVWTALVPSAALNLQNGDQPSVTAELIIADAAGNTHQIITDEFEFSVDTEITADGSVIDLVEDQSFTVTPESLADGTVTFTGHVTNKDTTETITEVELVITTGDTTSTVTQTFKSTQTVNGVVWTINPDGTWAVDIASLNLNLVDGSASVKANIKVEDNAGNTKQLNSVDTPFEIEVGIISNSDVLDLMQVFNAPEFMSAPPDAFTVQSFKVLSLLDGSSSPQRSSDPQNMSPRLMGMATTFDNGSDEPSARASAEFTIGAIEGYADSIGKVEVTVQIDALLTVAKSYGVVLQKQNDQGVWEDYMSAPLGDKGVLASLGTQYALGAIGEDKSTNTISFNGLPPGEYRVKTYGAESDLTRLIKEVELAKLGSGGYLLGKENQEALIDAVLQVLSQNGSSPSAIQLVSLVTNLLDVVNTITSPIAWLVNTLISNPLLQTLLNAIDQALDVVIADLVSNTLGLLEQTTIDVKVFESYYTNADVEYLTEGQSLNVLDNDGPNLKVTGIGNHDGLVKNVDATGAVKIAGQYGELTISSNGQYSYKIYPSENTIGKTDVFTYFVQSTQNANVQQQSTLTINIHGGAVESITAVDNDVGISLDITPTISDLATKSVDAGGLAYIGLGSILDVGALNLNRALEFNVAHHTERKITFEAQSGGIQVLTDYDLFIYKLNVDTNKYELYSKQEKWFGVGLLGGKTTEGLTLTIGEGKYIALLEPSSGINVAFGYTLKTTKDQLLDYANPEAVLGKATGNVISNIDLVKGEDYGQNIDVSYITHIQGNAGQFTVVTDSFGQGVTVQGKYGSLTIFGNGDYVYMASNDKTFNYGDIDSFTYTIYDPITGQSSSAQLNIKLDYISSYQDIQTEIALLEISPQVHTIANADLNNIAKNPVTGGQSSATAFGVANINLGDVIDVGLISTENAIRIEVDTGEITSLKFKATGYDTIALGSSYDLLIYKKNANGQLELYYSKNQFLTIPLSILIPIGGIYNTPINMSFSEGEYFAYLTSGKGVGVIGGATLSVSDISVQDFNDPILYHGELDGGIDVEANFELYSVNGKVVESNQPLVIEGEYGTLMIHANGSYSYVVDHTANTPPYGKIDSFSYVIKSATSTDYKTAVLNIQIATIEANKDLSLNQDLSEHLISSSMVNLITQVDVNEASGTLQWRESLTKDIYFTVDELNALQSLKFTLNAKLAVQGIYTSSMSYKIYRLDDIGGVMSRVLVGEATTNNVTKNQTTLVTNIDHENLSVGNYVVELSVAGHNASRTEYSYDLDITQVHLDRWSYKDGVNYSLETVSGNFLSNDHFSEGLYNQTLIKFNHKYLSLDPHKAIQTHELAGKYGVLIVKSDGSYTYTPNGQGGGRDIFEYELVSPTGEIDRSTIEFNIGKVVKGSIGADSIESGAADDIYTLGQGSDTLIFDILNRSSANGGNGFDTWTDFSIGLNQDRIDISKLLIDVHTNQNTNDYVFIEKRGADLILSIDRDGEQSNFAKADLLKLSGIANDAIFDGKTNEQILDLLIQNNQLIY